VLNYNEVEGGLIYWCSCQWWHCYVINCRQRLCVHTHSFTQKRDTFQALCNKAMLWASDCPSL